MCDFEFVSGFGKLCLHLENARKDRDYVVVQAQMDKLAEIAGFLMREAEIQNGRMEPVLLSPREIHGGITAYFPVFDLYGKRLEAFCKLMEHTSAFSVDASEEGVCISCTVPDVFKPNVFGKSIDFVVNKV